MTLEEKLRKIVMEQESLIHILHNLLVENEDIADEPWFDELEKQFVYMKRNQGELILILKGMK